MAFIVAGRNFDLIEVGEIALEVAELDTRDAVSDIDELAAGHDNLLAVIESLIADRVGRGDICKDCPAVLCIR